MKNSAKKEVILHYKGQLEFDSIGDLIHQLKENIRDLHIRYVLYKKLLMLMIESLENIIRYREHFDNNSNIRNNFPPEFSISIQNKYFVIESSNAILNVDIGRLQSRLIQLRSLDKKKVKEMYRNTITNGQFTEKGGAGLGIIEMVKITDRKIEFSFKEIDEQYSYFYLKLCVKNVDVVNDTVNMNK